MNPESTSPNFHAPVLKDKRSAACSYARPFVNSSIRPPTPPVAGIARTGESAESGSNQMFTVLAQPAPFGNVRPTDVRHTSTAGRRTFITAAAKKITEAGGSLRDIQELAGYANLATT